ncbi:MAG: hypothetical protein GX639_03910 [Fibrobacter sp.]|nr:hypothetical protein [Fibrobacter sp.]
MSVEGVRGGGGNVDAVNAILMQATQKSVEAAEKLMKFTVGQAVGAEIGKGGNFDVQA